MVDAPGEPRVGREHAEPAEEAGSVADLDVVDEDVPLGEEDFPIVVAGADEGQRKRAGVGHVCADIEEIFEEPEGAEGDAGGFAFDEEIRKTGERGDEFGEGAAEDVHGVTERAEKRMAGFVNGEIGEIDDEKIGRVERGVEEEEGVEDGPGDAGGFGDRLPLAEAFSEIEHERSVAAAVCREKGGRKRVSREAGRIATESQRTQREEVGGRRELLSAAEAAAGGLFDQAVTED